VPVIWNFGLRQAHVPLVGIRPCKNAGNHSNHHVGCDNYPIGWRHVFQRARRLVLCESLGPTKVPAVQVSPL
jgi:hypothetical protein